jgi:integrase/recombinase XerD
MARNEFVEPYQAFVRYLEVQDYTRQSIQAYTSALKPFMKFLLERGIGSFAGVDSETMIAYQDYVYGDLRTMVGKNVSGQYQRRLLGVVHLLYTYLVQRGMVKTDPAGELVLPRLARKGPREVLTAEELRRLYDACDTTTTPGYRDRLVLELLFAAGLSHREVMDLSLSDIDPTRCEVLVTRAGRKRSIAVAEATAAMVAEYIEKHRLRLMDPLEPDHDRLLVNDKGAKLTQSFLHGMLTRCAEAANVRKKMHTGMFRNLFSLRLLDKDIPLRTIQQILGSGGDESEGTLEDLRKVVESVYIAGKGA